MHIYIYIQIYIYINTYIYRYIHIYIYTQFILNLSFSGMTPLYISNRLYYFYNNSNKLQIDILYALVNNGILLGSIKN